MIRRPPRSTQSRSSAASDVYKRQLKKYGMMVADNGADWYVGGAPDPRWDDEALHSLDQVKGSDFEVVDSRALLPGAFSVSCLLYTSDAADDLLCVDLGGRR